jgi:hypothetical protein
MSRKTRKTSQKLKNVNIFIWKSDNRKPKFFLVAANYDNTVCERILYTKRILLHNYNHKTINYFLRIKVFLLLMIFSRKLT